MPLAKYCEKCRVQYDWPTSARTKVTLCLYCGARDIECYISDSALLGTPDKKTGEPLPEVEPTVLGAEIVENIKKRGRGRPPQTYFSESIFGKSPDQITVKDLLELKLPLEKAPSGALTLLDEVFMRLGLARLSGDTAVRFDLSTGQKSLVDVFWAVCVLRANGFSSYMETSETKSAIHVSWNPVGDPINGKEPQAG